MSDYEDIIMQRVHKVRGMWEIDYTELDEDAVCEGVEFVRDGLRILVLPTIADGVLAVDVMAFNGDEMKSDWTIVVRS